MTDIIMKYAVVVPTNRTDQTIGPLLISLTHQTLLPHEIIVVADIDFVDDAQEESYRRYIEMLLRGYSYTLITHATHPDFIPGQ